MRFVFDTWRKVRLSCRVFFFSFFPFVVGCVAPQGVQLHRPWKHRRVSRGSTSFFFPLLCRCAPPCMEHSYAAGGSTPPLFPLLWFGCAPSRKAHLHCQWEHTRVCPWECRCVSRESTPALCKERGRYTTTNQPREEKAFRAHGNGGAGLVL